MKQNKNKINVVETWFLVARGNPNDKKNPIAFAKNLWKVPGLELARIFGQ